MKRLFLLIPVIILLASCSASFIDGGFLIPVVCLFAALFFFRSFVKTRERYQLVFGLILAAAAVAIYLVMETAK